MGDKLFKKWKSFEEVFDTPTTQNENVKRKKKVSVKKFTLNFGDEILPKAPADLAVHPKKVREVEEWLKMNFKENKSYSSLLLISGPTGSGKTTTLKVLCKSLDISVVEWINPVDVGYEYTGENLVAPFRDFIIQSQYQSFFVKESSQMTLVREFPNAFVKQPERFWEILEEVKCRPKIRIAFVCTDSQSLKSLFAEEVMGKYNIQHITFNACAPTILNNALKRVLNAVKQKYDDFKAPSSEVVEAIAATSMGDIRNALNQLSIACTNNAKRPVLVVETNTANGRKRKRKTNVGKIKCMEKDENLGLFHGLGRVLNPKWTYDEKRLNCNVDSLVDEFIIQPNLFVTFLFENYLRYFGSVKNIEDAAESLSYSANFLEYYGERDDLLIYALWITTLGLMVYNRKKVSKWNQIRGPVKVQKYVKKFRGVTRIDACDEFYYKLIEGENK